MQTINTYSEGHVFFIFSGIPEKLEFNPFTPSLANKTSFAASIETLRRSSQALALPLHPRTARPHSSSKRTHNATHSRVTSRASRSLLHGPALMNALRLISYIYIYIHPMLSLLALRALASCKARASPHFFPSLCGPLLVTIYMAVLALAGLSSPTAPMPLPRP